MGFGRQCDIWPAGWRDITTTSIGYYGWGKNSPPFHHHSRVCVQGPQKSLGSLISSALNSIECSSRFDPKGMLGLE